MKSCFGYIRVSTLRQGEGASLGAQRDAIERYASRNDITITAWFEEKETAAKAGRPIFTEMIKRLRRKEVKGVVLHKVDRGARLLSEWSQFAELADTGIDVHFATETLDFRSRGGRLTADIQAVIAADYIRNLREETLKGLEGRLKQGIYPFKAPLGYRDHGGGKVKTIDPEKGPLVRLMFELYATGEYSLRSLPKKMAEHGLIIREGTPYSKAAIEKVLRNPFYTGVIKIRKTGKVYQGIHEPLITQQVFDAVQAVKLGRTVKVISYHHYQFKGLFACGLCGMAMIAEKQKGTVYYRCHTATCETKTVREEVIDAGVRSALAHSALTEDAVAELLTLSERWYAKVIKLDTTRSHNLRLHALEDRLERTTDAYIDRMIDEPTFERRKERIFQERARLIAEREAQQNAFGLDDMRQFLELMKNLVVHYETALPEEKRQIIRLATSNRTVSRRNVVVEPAEWLTETAHAVSGCLCGQSRPAPRTAEAGEHIATLMNIVAQNRKQLAAIARCTAIDASRHTPTQMSREIGRKGDS